LEPKYGTEKKEIAKDLTKGKLTLKTAMELEKL
jgi:hypothetical protein